MATTISSSLPQSTLYSYGSSSPSSSTNGVNLAMSGLASGMNWQTLVTELANAERAPETQWKQTQSTINQKNSAFSTISSDLSNLQTAIQTLQDPSLYESTAVQTSNSSVATASSDTGAAAGSYTFNVSQLATAAQMQGTAGISTALSPSGNLSNVIIGTAGFSTPVTAGTFTINGQQINIATTDSLQTVFNNIASATGNAVTASYDSSTDKITLSSSSPITLGSATDTSNFLQVAQLFNNGSGTVTSGSALGHAQLTTALDSTNLTTAITDGGSGQGAFTINGVTINYSASGDNINDVLARINSSAAGVTASYDALNNRFVLTNKTTGDVGISMQDVTGNFLAATGLSGGTLASGKNLLYTIGNNPQQLVSQTNTITGASSGINGLTVNALSTGSVTATVSTDTSKVSTAIQSFVSAYNSVQKYITSQMAVTTASDGSVTAGTLTGDQTAVDIASSLRSISFGPLSGLSGTMNQLADLGIQTNGQDNSITTDTTTLNDALTNNLDSVKALFTDSTNGLATQLNNYLNDTIGDNGTLVAHQASLTQQSNNINTQISNLESTISSDSARWTSEFQAMEQAQSQINQQLQYLTQQINNGTL